MKELEKIVDSNGEPLEIVDAEAREDISEIKQSLSDIEDVIVQIDGITIYKQIINQDIISFSAESSMPIMKLVANISNVSGCTEANITICGTNVWDEEWELGSINPETGANVNSNYIIRSKNYILVNPNTAYYHLGRLQLFFYDKDKNYISYLAFTNEKVFTTPSNAVYMRFTITSAYGTTYNNDISINYPSTDSSYHAYNGHTYNIPFVVGGNTITIYNGTYDLISGVLIDNDNSTTYHLPATPINDLQGQNNIWSDTGSIANIGYLDILNIS